MDKWLRNPNVVKVVALMLGIMLWVVVRMDGNTGNISSVGLKEQTISNVAVVPKYDSSQYYVSSIEPSEVTIRLKGRQFDIDKVSTSNYKIELDLTKASAGEYYLAPMAVGLPSSLDWEIYPRTVKVAIEKQQKKEVPVVIDVTGTPKEGFKAGQPIVKPNRVHVTVPDSKADLVDSVHGEISVDQADSTIKQQVKLRAFDKKGKELDFEVSPAVVDVEVPVTMPFKAMPLQIKLVGDPPPGFAVASVKQSTDKVTVYSNSPNDLDKMEFYEGPEVNLADLKEMKKFTLDIPHRNNVTQTDPDKVDVTVEIVPSVTKQVENFPLNITGLAKNMNAKITTPESGQISFTMEGAQTLLNEVKLEDIQAAIDVTNLPPGDHEVTVNINLPPYIKNATGEIKATVTITEKKKRAK
ncbi:CdaR family protein [Paenibacillus larvae]